MLRIRRYIYIFAILNTFVICAFAQQKGHVDYELTSEAVVSSGDYTPYMLTVNRHDVLSSRANTGYLSAGIMGSYQFNDLWNISGGLKGIASVHSNHKVYLQELYLHATYRKMYLEIGAREKSSPVLNDLLTSGDFICSGNAKPIPTIHVATEGFVTLPFFHDWLQVYADFGYGRLLDDDWLEGRFTDYHKTHYGSFYTSDVVFHHKELFFKTNPTKLFYGTIGMHHSVMFGGIKTSYESGQLQVSDAKATFKDLFRVLFPRSNGNKSKRGDGFVYGNYVGAWYLDFGYNHSDINSFRFYLEKPFEDGSGIAFRNGLDGIWGGEYNSHRSYSILKGLVVEYIQTTNQSGPIHWAPADFDSSISNKVPSEATGADNYYNNFFYNGYSHYGKSIGSALLKEPYYNEDKFLNYTDNRIHAWHLGVNGDISKEFGYLAKVSYREGYGTYFVPLRTRNHSFDSLFQIQWNRGNWHCSTGIAITQGNIYGNTYGFDVKITYHGKIL